MPHIMYLSSFTDAILNAYKTKSPNSEVNVLLSYGTRSGDYMNMIKSPEINSMALDSGAFTKNFAKSEIAWIPMRTRQSNTSIDLGLRHTRNLAILY